MITQDNLKKLFLPLVGINSYIYKKEVLGIHKIGFKIKDVAYSRYILYILTDSESLITTLTKLKRIKERHTTEEGMTVLSLQTITKQEKDEWKLLLTGKYDKLTSWYKKKVSAMYTKEMWATIQAALKGDDDYYIDVIASKLIPRSGVDTRNRAEDLFYSEEELFKKQIKQLKINLNYL